MLDVILDCFGALLLFGQVVWFLAEGPAEAAPDMSAAWRHDAARRPDGCST